MFQHTSTTELAIKSKVPSAPFYFQASLCANFRQVQKQAASPK